MVELPHVHVIGVTHDIAVYFPELDMEIWGHAHLDYSDMVPLREPRPKTARWHIALAHGHYEDDGAIPLRPSWLISNARDRRDRSGLCRARALEPGGSGRNGESAGVLFGVARSGEDGERGAADA